MQKSHVSNIGAYILLVTGASFGILFAVLTLFAVGNEYELLGLPWRGELDTENIVLRALIVNIVQSGMWLIPVMFRGHAVVSDQVRRRMHYAHVYVLSISWLALILKYFSSPVFEMIELVVGLIGFTCVAATAYILYLYLGIYRNVDNRLLREKEMSQTFYEQMMTDQLTKLPNRMKFQEQLSKYLVQAQNDPKQKAAFLFLDLDGFKYVNDSLGHKNGDYLLQEVAKRLSSCLQNGQQVYRMGGDEFLFVLKGLHFYAKEEAIRAAKRILESLQAPIVVEEQELIVTTSIGIAMYPDHGHDVDTLYTHADAAMYRAKEEGRNSYHLYDPKTKKKHLDRLALEKSLRIALERQEFQLYYQPQVDLQSGRIIGAEALLRWMHPEWGVVSPADFIPVAEDTNLILPLGEWVLQEACRQAKEWHDAGTSLCIAVNLSARQFQQQDLVKKIRGLLMKSGLPPASLDIEITESMTMNAVDHSIKVMKDLTNLGVRISIDDFGTSYSSLSYLKKFPIHTLKIDRAFVKDINEDTDDAAIATAIIAMAHSLKLHVIAEGVEEKNQLEFLREHGCDAMQGFLVSRPIPAKEFGELLRTWNKRAHEFVKSS